MIHPELIILWNYHLLAFDPWGAQWCKIFQNLFVQCCQKKSHKKITKSHKILLYWLYYFLSNVKRFQPFSWNRVNKTPLGKTSCLSNHYLFPGCWNIQFFNSFMWTYGTRCVIIGHHSHVAPRPYLQKQRISFGVAIIQSLLLCSHTQFTCNLKVLALMVYWRVSFCCETLYLPLTFY